MTRFARSQGSKASNEKLPEDATPWLVMKQQILGSQQTVSKDEGFKSSLDNPDETNRNLKWATFRAPEGIHKQNINRLTAVENEGKKDKKKSKKTKDKYLDNSDVSLSKLSSNSFVSKSHGGPDVPNGFMSPKKKKLRKQKLTMKYEHVEGENETDVQNKNTEDYISEHGDKIIADNGSSKNISKTKRMKKLRKKQNMQLVNASNENTGDNTFVSKNVEKMSKRKFSDVGGAEIGAESEVTTHNDNISYKNKIKVRRTLDAISNCDKNKNIKKKKKRKGNSSVNDLSNWSNNSQGGVVGEESINILDKNVEGYIGNKWDEVTVENSKHKNTSETKRMKKLKKKENKQLLNIINENFNNEADQICISENNEKMSKTKCNLDIVELRNENKIIKLNDSRSKKKLKRKHDAVSNCNESKNTKKKKRKVNNSVNGIQNVTVNKKEERTEVLNEAKEEVASKKIKKKLTHYLDDHSLREVQKEMNETLSGAKPHARKNNKLFGEPREFIINGMKVEIVKYQGFEIELEEAKRIENLRKQLNKEKKVSYEEVAKIIKLERRKAEKALSRKKKKVCLKCRGYGHLLSQCPELEEGYVSGQGTGICFKCGSTEHTHFNCRVIRGDQYRFASCFMCGEEGHIARQCSLNSNGIYPKGGSCRNCGDVNHLMRNCPQLDKQKESKTITVGTIKDSKLESLEEDVNKEEMPTQARRKNSIIKF